MADPLNPLSKTFLEFFRAEGSSTRLLLLCTVVSLVAANSSIGPAYLDFWQGKVGGLTVSHWINDGLMAVFFLSIGLELEREFYVGELAELKNALLPIVAAAGGVMTPTLIHFALNSGTGTQAGAGIPMATDIAFALGALALLGSRMPASLKVFLTALAVMDDLAAMIVIAVFYAAEFSLSYLLGSLLVFAVLLTLNRVFRVMRLLPYLLGGVVMWVLMLKSGVHATLAGVLLAFAIPFSAIAEDERSPSHRLEHLLHRPVAWVVLPVFALANTAILVLPGWHRELLSANSIGIMAGLVLGKPLGIALFTFVAVALKVCRIPADLTWNHIVGAGLLGGIGFTMSIFITNLAFTGLPEFIDSSKVAILISSVVAGAGGLLWLKLSGTAPSPGEDSSPNDALAL